MTRQILIKELEKKYSKYVTFFYQKLKEKNKAEISIQDIKNEISYHLDYLNKERAYFKKVEMGLALGPTSETIRIILNLISNEKNRASRLLDNLVSNN
ncbi:MAG: hypothetical protein AB1393_08205 [Candidatus Edwardsbacteria bacterium]